MNAGISSSRRSATAVVVQVQPYMQAPGMPVHEQRLEMYKPVQVANM